MNLISDRKQRKSTRQHPQVTPPPMKASTLSKVQILRSGFCLPDDEISLTRLELSSNHVKDRVLKEVEFCEKSEGLRALKPLEIFNNEESLPILTPHANWSKKEVYDPPVAFYSPCFSVVSFPPWK